MFNWIYVRKPDFYSHSLPLMDAEMPANHQFASMSEKKGTENMRGHLGHYSQLPHTLKREFTFNSVYENISV